MKIDPKSIGAGQYQHDVDQKSCVNRVGVDLNTASWALQRCVLGINERTALEIVEYRNQHGRFRSRQQLMEVSGFAAARIRST